MRRIHLFLILTLSVVATLTVAHRMVPSFRSTAQSGSLAAPTEVTASDNAYSTKVGISWNGYFWWGEFPCSRPGVEPAHKRSENVLTRLRLSKKLGCGASNRETGNPVAGLPPAPASSRRRPAYARVCSASVYRARQTRTSSKNSPARRPVRRFTCRVTRSSRRSPASARIRG